MAKIVYVIYVNTGTVGVCLDAIRLFASPDAKRFSHVTVRGPYNYPLDDIELAQLNSILDEKSIIINGVGNFFNENQNTVFFTCHSNSLQRIWQKSDYPNYNPHITIYDGDNLAFAQKIYNIISKYQYNVQCGQNKLMSVEIGNGKNGYLAESLDERLLPQNLGLSKNFKSQIYNMTIEDRLNYIEKLCEFLAIHS